MSELPIVIDDDDDDVSSLDPEFSQIIAEIFKCFTDQPPRPVSHDLLATALLLAADNNDMIAQVYQASRGPPSMPQERRTEVIYGNLWQFMAIYQLYIHQPSF